MKVPVIVPGTVNSITWKVVVVNRKPMSVIADRAIHYSKPCTRSAQSRAGALLSVHPLLFYTAWAVVLD